MFTKIIVGVDGQDGGRDAVALAAALAGEQTQLVLVNAFPYERYPSRASLEAFEQVLRDDAFAVLATAEGELERLAEKRAVADPSPGRVLQHIAEEEAADLIVIGSCHRGPVARVMLGDVSRAVLHGAPCPVLVAPHGWKDEPKRIMTIAVGYTRTPEGQAALDLAAKLAADTDATLRVLTAITPPAAFAPTAAYSYDWNSIHEGQEKVAREDLEEATADLDLPCIVETSEGSAGADLAKVSQHVQLLVVGSRGWGAARRVVLGSTSDYLAHHAHCPVLVVPAPARVAETVG